MEIEIPFERLGIPSQVRKTLSEDAPVPARLALANGLLPTTADVQLAICYVLATHQDAKVSAAARKTLVEMPTKQVLPALNHRTHPKILEFLVEFREPARELDERILRLRSTNDRTARLIAARADEDLCERLSYNQERLLLTPAIYLDLHGNPACDEQTLHRVEGFLRMHRMLPEAPGQRPFQHAAPVPEPPRQPQSPPPLGSDLEMDLEAEVMAAISGQQSPALLQAQGTGGLEMFDVDALAPSPELAGGFSFDFADEDAEFGWQFTRERDEVGAVDDGERIPLEQALADMAVGKKIKLAYLGNKEVRSILIRDQNSTVSVAVVKSGRMTDGEIAASAANRNLADDVIRNIAQNREFTRKYPVKVALVNNPKTPQAIAMGFITTLNRRDLQQLARNRNVPSAVFQMAKRLYKTKYQS